MVASPNWYMFRRLEKINLFRKIGDPDMSKFLLRSIDKSTGCFNFQMLLENANERYLLGLLEVHKFEIGDVFELKEFELAILADQLSIELSCDNVEWELTCISDQQVPNFSSHTGRELKMMLNGDKPFSAFVDTVPGNGDKIIPENYFQPFVESGKLVKSEFILNSNDANSTQIRHVMYALPSEKWRFEAYFMMWHLAGKYGWNAGFERIEGFILGYEESLDKFFARD